MAISRSVFSLGISTMASARSFFTRFTIRDIMWATVVIALTLMWRGSESERSQLAIEKIEITAARDTVILEKDNVSQRMEALIEETWRMLVVAVPKATLQKQRAKKVAELRRSRQMGRSLGFLDFHYLLSAATSSFRPEDSVGVPTIVVDLDTWPRVSGPEQ